MLFSSIEFVIFLPIVFFIYWFITYKNLTIQNTFILLASYFFYGWWDYRFLFLIAFSSLVDFWVGIGIDKSNNIFQKKFYLFSSLFVNLSFLCFFKYFNFFTENFIRAFTFLGHPISDPFFLKIAVPVGISFYTFQTISYSIDVYKGKLKPTRDIVAFFSFVSFFPQLVAGPIERATNLLPQFQKKRLFEYNTAVDGLRQILWGLFIKTVIGDNLAIYVNEIFENYLQYSGSVLFIGIVFFAFQIYCDFSGYSEIAIGTSKLFGFNIIRNFAFPYFSRDIAEFWRRWHISLSSWFRDYVYIPLGGSRVSTIKKIRNVFIIFIVSGFWHGANWTFIIWGALNALYFLPLMVLNINRKNKDIVSEGRFFPRIKELFQIGATFILILFAWVFFRSESVVHALQYINHMLSWSFFQYPNYAIKNSYIFYISCIIVVDWLQREKQHALQFDHTTCIPKPVRWMIYYGIIFSILLFKGKKQEFIYFQF